MKKKIVVVIMLMLPLLIGFDYDPNDAEYKIIGEAHLMPNEEWHCEINYSGTYPENGFARN